ncbi:glycosyltransferase [Salipiger pacificus]|nr:glycosyltransferase [Alloyangia pacifica]MCA0948012.1 glycosyltransferase [Alloyangia pacifica]
MKVALIHYWLVGMRGGEKVLEELCKLYPDADIFTHVAVPEKLSDTILDHQIYETFISKLPGARKHYQKYLPLMPLALESLDLTSYDLVISSESGPAKGVITRPDALHVCYVHSPMRYIWDQYHVYRESSGIVTRILMPIISQKMRVWDAASSARVDKYISNSKFVAQRVEKAWRRASEVIYPPVDVSAFKPEEGIEPEEFYLYAGELASYKRADIAVQAFRKTGRKLVVVGTGAEREKLMKSAGKNIEFVGRVSFAELKSYYARCKALVFPGIEDFGIIPLEVMASGRPVVAYNAGGAKETVIDGKTGVLFGDPSSDSLNEAIDRLENIYPSLRMHEIVEHAKGFSPEIFSRRISNFIESELAERQAVAQ